jgi:hypothetical protein
MQESDLQAQPVYHLKRDSIEAHLTIVFAALAVSHCSAAAWSSATPSGMRATGSILAAGTTAVYSA